MCFLDIFVNISGKIALENRENMPGENMAKNVHNFDMDIVFLNIAHKIIIFLSHVQKQNWKMDNSLEKTPTMLVVDKRLISLKHKEILFVN